VPAVTPGSSLNYGSPDLLPKASLSPKFARVGDGTVPEVCRLRAQVQRTRPRTAPQTA